MNTPLLQEFVEKSVRKKALEAEAKALGVELSRIEPELREEFAADGMQRTTIQGHTIYLKRSIVASVMAGCMPNVCKALPQVGGGDLVKENVNANSLSAFVREMERDLDDLPILPDELKDLVNVYERMQLSVIKA